MTNSDISDNIHMSSEKSEYYKGVNKMERYNYHKAIKEDIRVYIGENYTEKELSEQLLDIDAFQEKLHDALWIEDSVTGNGSGSYTFNTWKAKEYVIDNFEILKDACTEFDTLENIGEKLLDEEWEYLDVTIRCYLLGQAIAETLEELQEKHGANVPF